MTNLLLLLLLLLFTVHENCALLGCYAECGGSFLLTFRTVPKCQ